MKKKLTYRDQLLELAKIYNVKEVQDYIRNKKNLTSGQIELILRKNKIIIPKDYKTNFFRENISKPLLKFSRHYDDYIFDSLRKINKTTKRFEYLKDESVKATFKFFSNTWKNIGNVGSGFLNILPKLGQTYYTFFGKFFVDLFHGIYSQQFNAKKSGQVAVIFVVIMGLTTILISGIATFKNLNEPKEKQLVLKENQINKKELKIKKEIQKPKIETKRKVEKLKRNINKKVKKKEKTPELILPDLNLKTATVLTLFDEVNYDLNKVRNNKIVKPIYFTQFPKDLDEIQSTKLKKETFIKIVLPLIVAENEKILDDRFKLKKIVSKKNTSDDEKQWLRQKFLEYRVKKGSVEELKVKMDIIPTSIALAQAAKESGWGTSRFALEGNAIFGQWTWNGKGIEPLLKDKSKNHKILRFPILRASVKAYKNNLNTHSSYVKFREKRKNLRKKNKTINGLELAQTLNNYAQTGSEYTRILAKIIIQNKLTDFEPVKLSSSDQRNELNL